jgi:hypothetical protein
MAERTPSPRNVVRAEGFEVLDAEGRVRISMGLMHDVPGEEVWGVSVRDADGAERAWLASSGADGCEVGLAFAGNIVARMQVDRAGEAFVYLADPTGTPASEWP